MEHQNSDKRAEESYKICDRCQNFGLHMPTMCDEILQLEALSDSDFAIDKETRISV